MLVIVYEYVLLIYITNYCRGSLWLKMMEISLIHCLDAFGQNSRLSRYMASVGVMES